jgi:uncharacterized membrane protein YphA (DoxX/SURF4 family)
MNTILWICQGLLAVVFLYSGVNKTFLSEQQLIAKGQTGVVHQPAYLIHSIGILEVLGAIGILVPWYTGIYPVLTPVTAICFALLMMLAAPIHYRLKEPKNVAINTTIFIVSVFVAFERASQL